MEIEINSTWSLDGAEGFENATYRVLSIEYDIQAIILFPLLSTKKILRPKIILISTFERLAEENIIQACEDEASQNLMINDDELSEKHKERRDTRYRKIESLIKDDSFLLKVATQIKVPDISRQAKEQNSDNKSIYRILNTYWHFGQTLNSLAPAYKFCGGRGKIRENVKHSLGRRIKPRTAGFSEVSSYIVRAEDLKKFEICLRKYYLKPRGVNLKETYLNTLRTQYTDVIVNSEESGTAPRVPSYRQFVNWSKKIIGADESIQARSTETEYLRNKRGVEASITDKTGIPGSCFEIDATVADAHIVSELRRNHVIGRPTIYSIVDRASRLIVGFHVSLYFASWDAARQALVNAFTPKVDYCRNYGIEIDSCQWPSSHIPQRLICDNGELIGLKAEQLLVPLTELKIAPPYRPDCKAIVERRFGYLNDKEIHHLLGSSRGGKIVRGSPDPRKNAVYTLREVSAILIREVLEHNKQIFSELAMSTPLLIEEDLAPTPNNYWKIHLEKHKHALKTASIKGSTQILRTHP